MKPDGRRLLNAAGLYFEELIQRNLRHHTYRPNSDICRNEYTNLYRNKCHLICVGHSTGFSSDLERVLISESHMHPWKSMHTAKF